MRRPLSAFGFLLLLLTLVAGCGPRWAILAQANPDPLVGAKDFYIEPIHYDGLIVGSKGERDYQADKSPDQQESWRVDKLETGARYADAVRAESPGLRFTTAAAPGVFIVRPVVSYIEPGFYAAFVAKPTELRMVVQILSSDGRMIDEIALHSVIGASLIYPASGTRMRLAGEDLGRVTAQYLRKRVTGV
jgi:hypothetical protein